MSQCLPQSTAGKLIDLITVSLQIARNEQLYASLVDIAAGTQPNDDEIMSGDAFALLRCLEELAASCIVISRPAAAGAQLCTRCKKRGLTRCPPNHGTSFTSPDAIFVEILVPEMRSEVATADEGSPDVPTEAHPPSPIEGFLDNGNDLELAKDHILYSCQSESQIPVPSTARRDDALCYIPCIAAGTGLLVSNEFMQPSTSSEGPQHYYMHSD
ncbi:hypothetical protein DFH11DRAFT_1541080 [Phellopilus nigrolimitatus]|nr:hypothetical protein DFH11DRAFT_1541080 [Phellopilus nigrolimitatus]